MTCRDVNERLSRFVEADLDAESREAVAAHLEACPACRRAHEALVLTLKGLGSLPREAAPADLAERIRRRAEAQPTSPGWHREALLAAAVALLALGTAVVGRSVLA
ncbi:MAG: hypothetical protein D6729_01175, partial [Deltaproteobacteria bacterium]